MDKLLRIQYYFNLDTKLSIEQVLFVDIDNFNTIYSLKKHLLIPAMERVEGSLKNSDMGFSFILKLSLNML